MKPAREYALLIFIILLTCIPSGCKQAETQPGQLSDYSMPSGKKAGNPPAHASGKIRIGFAMDTLAEERWERDRELFRKAAEELGAEVKILASRGDDALQILQAEKLINEGIDVLVVVPHNAESTAMIVKKAHAEGIKVLSYDRLVRNSEIDFYVSYDNVMVGELQAEAITNLVPKGNYVYIGGAETDYNAHLFKKGVFNVLKPFIDRGDIKIVYDQWTKDWIPEYANANMKEALRANHNRIDAVISANDATAGQVIRAMEEVGLSGKIPVAGQDADLAAAQRIVEDTQTMTIYKPLSALTVKAAELAIKLASGEEVEGETMIHNGKWEVPAILLSPIAVDKNNINETIIKDDFHSEQDVYSSEKK